ncbi:uncharacterized protein EMH_0058940 [Eimeria mitis]|uniref:Uncharacterized protein n=1 Tax=Eimeria mitis TaxID=44415 RepID=U6K2F8_9EIME|nr:uncharacterized protein EMH_0058940 [Eimeria mitis]CDJ30512.1 hypothetical protein, conserved [Eimeria mitis]
MSSQPLVQRLRPQLAPTLQQQETAAALPAAALQELLRIAALSPVSFEELKASGLSDVCLLEVAAAAAAAAAAEVQQPPSSAADPAATTAAAATAAAAAATPVSSYPAWLLAALSLRMKETLYALPAAVHSCITWACRGPPTPTPAALQGGGPPPSWVLLGASLQCTYTVCRGPPTPTPAALQGGGPPPSWVLLGASLQCTYTVLVLAAAAASALWLRLGDANAA